MWKKIYGVSFDKDEGLDGEFQTLQDEQSEFPYRVVLFDWDVPFHFSNTNAAREWMTEMNLYIVKDEDDGLWK
jgi:hypothetical protein